MKRFLVQIACLAIGLLAIVAIMDTVNDPDPKLGASINILMGDSHAGPLNFPSFANLSMAGDPFFVQWCKAHRWMDVSGQAPECMILTVGPHNFSELPESRIRYNRDNWRSSNAERLAALAKLEDYPLRMPPFVWPDALIKELVWPELETLHNAFNETKQYVNTAAPRTKQQLVVEPGWYLEDGYAQWTLGQMAEACQAWGAQLILLETPRHGDYDELVGAEGMKRYRDDLAKFADMHERVYFVPSTSFDWETAWFKDSDHLNSYGVDQMTQALIQQPRLVPQEFINLFEPQN